MDEVQRLYRVARVDDARDVDLVCTLADHLDVHVSLPERREHASRHPDHIPHFFADQREDRHIPAYSDLVGKAAHRHEKS